MTIQLFSVEHAPVGLPSWDTILDDLGRPPAHRISKALDVGISTVYRWNQDGEAPRAACLALFWLTRWGRSHLNAQAINDAVVSVQLAQALTLERDQLRRQVGSLITERNYLAELVERFQPLLEHARGTAALLELPTPAPSRGNGASANRSHTGNAPADPLPVAWPSIEPPALAWPLIEALEPASARPDLRHSKSAEAAQPSTELEASEAPDHPGSPAAPPPPRHSTAGRQSRRRRVPPAAASLEVVASEPSAPQLVAHSHHFDTTEPPASQLLELRQARRRAASPPPAASDPPNNPFEQSATPAAAAYALPRPSAPGNDDGPQVVDAAKEGRAAPATAGLPEAPAPTSCAPAPPLGQPDEAPAAYGELSRATAPDPACSAFAALATALSGPLETAKPPSWTVADDRRRSPRH